MQGNMPALTGVKCQQRSAPESSNMHQTPAHACIPLMIVTAIHLAWNLSSSRKQTLEINN